MRTANLRKHRNAACRRDAVAAEAQAMRRALRKAAA